MSAKARAEREAILRDWDQSGKVKTSAYWRLYDSVYPTRREQRLLDKHEAKP